MKLAEQACEVCRVGAPSLTAEELDGFRADIPEWEVVEIEGVQQLKREFLFADFKQAQAFTNKVSELAEQMGHHPALLLEWGKVTVYWWTHKIRGLHKSDVVMAAKTDLLPR